MRPVVLALIAVLATGGARAEGLDAFRAQASDWLLSGQGLPRDYRVTLMRMPAEDRLQAIAYLRRIGLLTDRPWSLDDLLRPAALDPEPAR